MSEVKCDLDGARPAYSSSLPAPQFIFDMLADAMELVTCFAFLSTPSKGIPAPYFFPRFSFFLLFCFPSVCRQVVFLLKTLRIAGGLLRPVFFIFPLADSLLFSARVLPGAYGADCFLAGPPQKSDGGLPFVFCFHPSRDDEGIPQFPSLLFSSL